MLCNDVVVEITNACMHACMHLFRRVLQRRFANLRHVRLIVF
jgi:hypothetical protein